MKGIILAGGRGTRMLPSTKTINKHLLPIYNKDSATPIIEYPISTLKNMGIEDILVITSREHCGAIVEYLGDGYNMGLNFTYKIQETEDPKRPIGIAGALKICKSFTENCKGFVTILGDNYYEPNKKINKTISSWVNNTNTKCGLFLKQTQEWERFGVAKLKGNKIESIIEKPKEFVSNLAVTGMYYYTNEVYEITKTLKPSRRGELEITDINDYYCKTGQADYLELDSFWSDMGTPESNLEVSSFLNSR